MWLDSFVLLYLCVIGIWDIKYKVVTYRALIIGVGLVVLHCFVNDVEPYLCMGGFIIGACFLGVSNITKESIGYGDSMVIFLLGGYLGIWQLIVCLCITFIWCGLYSGIQLATGHRNKSEGIPFLPFLALGYMGGMLL